LVFQGLGLDSSDSPKKKHGGKRNPPGGRPRGSNNTLEYGEVKAVKAAGLRVPDTAKPAERELADEALGLLVTVMRGGVHFMEAPTRLKAATRIREEICGPLATKVEHSGKDGGPMVFEFPPIPGDDEP
jgi:hypothetical protein